MQFEAMMNVMIAGRPRFEVRLKELSENPNIGKVWPSMPDMDDGDLQCWKAKDNDHNENFVFRK